jgi:hypothetical protein
MALLFVYSEPGAVPVAEFNDWYDNEHGPARLTVPGISAGHRFQALDGQAPSWLAYYEMKSGSVLDSPEYKTLWAAASAREKSIMSSLTTLDRRVYELISDSGSAPSAPAVVLAVSQSVPPDMEDELAAWYTEEHIPMLLAVPGWRRARRYRLTAGTAPAYLSLHDLASMTVFEEPAYRAAVSTPWMKRIVDSAIGRERRVFGLHKSFG